MDKSRGEQGPIDQNSPEFQKALEIAAQEIISKRDAEKEKGLPDQIPQVQKGDNLLGGFGSTHPDVQKTTALDSKMVSEDVQARVLNRALEILQGNKNIEDPHDLVDQLMQ
jgi:hypothetical protein